MAASAFNGITLPVRPVALRLSRWKQAACRRWYSHKPAESRAVRYVPLAKRLEGIVQGPVLQGRLQGCLDTEQPLAAGGEREGAGGLATAERCSSGRSCEGAADNQAIEGYTKHPSLASHQVGSCQSDAVRCVPERRHLEPNAGSPSPKNQAGSCLVVDKPFAADHEREGNADRHHQLGKSWLGADGLENIAACKQQISFHVASTENNKHDVECAFTAANCMSENMLPAVEGNLVSPAEHGFAGKASRCMEAHVQLSDITGKSNCGVETSYITINELTDDKHSNEHQLVPPAGQPFKDFKCIEASVSTEMNNHDEERSCGATDGTIGNTLNPSIQFSDKENLVFHAKQHVDEIGSKTIEAYMDHSFSAEKRKYDMETSCSVSSEMVDNKLSENVYFSDEQQYFVNSSGMQEDHNKLALSQLQSIARNKRNVDRPCTTAKTINCKGVPEMKGRFLREEDHDLKDTIFTRFATYVEDSFVDANTFDNFNELDSNEELQVDDCVNAPSEKLSQPASLSNLQNIESSSSLARFAVKDQALKYLAVRPLTAIELRKKLQKQNLSSKLIDLAINDLQSCGLQSDLMFAETYAQSRWNVQTWGPQRIRQALKSKGVAEDSISIALRSVFNDGDDGDTDNLLGMSDSAKENLLNQANKQWNRSKSITNDRRMQRLIRWLQYRRFDWKVITYVLKHLPRDTEQESA